MIRLAALLALCVALTVPALGMEPRAGTPASAPPAAIPPGPVTEAAFLAVAVPFVGRWEGLRLQSYLDIVGVWTVCYGHTRTAGPGQVKTRAECDALLAAELLEYRTRLHAYFTGETKARRLTPQRDTAYTSLAFNVGWAGAGRSTAVRRLNAGDIRGGCDAIGWWNKAGGRVVVGLVNRRTEEVAFCKRGL